MSLRSWGRFLPLRLPGSLLYCQDLLTQTTSTINTPMRIVTFEVAEVNHEVEDLEVGEDMNVQILQGDANANDHILR